MGGQGPRGLVRMELCPLVVERIVAVRRNEGPAEFVISPRTWYWSGSEASAVGVLLAKERLCYRARLRVAVTVGHPLEDAEIPWCPTIPVAPDPGAHGTPGPFTQ